MPAIPQGAFAACKVREHEQQIAKVQAAEQGDEKMFYNRKYLELSPLKYNSKLMNSIWGLYNRYSVHNFKKITDAEDVTLAAGSQQMATATADLPTTMDKLSTHAKASPSQPLPTATVLVADWIHVWGTHKSY